MEEYRQIPLECFKHRYQVSNMGNIYSIISKKCLKQTVNHINMNKIDNNVENLEWVTQSENTQKYYDNSTTSR